MNSTTITKDGTSFSSSTTLLVEKENDQPNVQPLLPSEILALSDAETACQFCGISYLLLNKMELLQKEFARLEKELEERKLFAGQKTKYDQQLMDYQSQLETITSQLKLNEKKEMEWKEEQKKIYSQLQTYMDLMSNQRIQLQNYTQFHSKTIYHTKHIYHLVQTFNLDLNQTKKTIQSELSDLQTFFFSNIKQVCQDYETHIQSIKETYAFQLQELSTEWNLKEQQWETWKLTYQEQLELSHQKVIGDLKQKADSEVLELKKTLESVHQSYQLALAQLETKEKEYQLLEKELNETKLQHQSIYKRLEHQCTELNETLKKEKEYLIESQAQIQNLTNRVAELDTSLTLEKSKQLQTQQQEHQLKSKLSNDDPQLSQRLKLETQVQSLLNEKQAMIQAHQHQIHDLQSTWQGQDEQWKASVCSQLEKTWEEKWNGAMQQWKEEKLEFQTQLTESLEKVQVEKEKRIEIEKEYENYQITVKQWKQSFETERSQLHTSLSKLKDTCNANQLEATKKYQHLVHQHETNLNACKDYYEEELQKLKETIRSECEERLKLVHQLKSIHLSSSSSSSNHPSSQSSDSTCIDSKKETNEEPPTSPKKKEPYSDSTKSKQEENEKKDGKEEKIKWGATLARSLKKSNKPSKSKSTFSSSTSPVAGHSGEWLRF